MPETLSGIYLTKPVIADELPGFAKGDVSVQDGAAQIATELLQLSNDQYVLDACAAPGGKLMHILECAKGVMSVVAIEKDADRMLQIEENLVRAGFEKTVLAQNEKVSNVSGTSWAPALGRGQRLGWQEGSSLTSICSDVNNMSDWWDGNPFDRILLDAPCSASGVIRRHPDIKLLRQPADLVKFAGEQQALLISLWRALKPGGMLVYVTCSIFPEENVNTIKKFLKMRDDAVEEKIDASWGVACEVGRQILPGQHNMDGFYFARLKKV
jgi:16S rRNA (cytosine967-C5)-methyltransferase